MNRPAEKPQHYGHQQGRGMENNTFGNLKDWGPVLESMEKLAKTGKLGDCQSELIRVLRYDDNWRLREAAIEYLADIRNPSPELIDEVYAIMMREDLYYDVRILAAYSLGKVISSYSKNAKPGETAADQNSGKVIDGMKRLLEDPQPPILHKAIRMSLEQIKG